MIEYSDRYGGDYPDPATMCDGECEGLGVYPEWNGERDEQGRIPLEGEGEWVMKTCETCGGTGKLNDN